MQRRTVGVGAGILLVVGLAIAFVTTEPAESYFDPCWSCTGPYKTAIGTGTGATCSEATQAARIDSHNKKNCSPGVVCWQYATTGPCQTVGGQKYVEVTENYRCEEYCCQEP